MRVSAGFFINAVFSATWAGGEDVLDADRSLKIAKKAKKGKISSKVNFIPTVHVVTHATESNDLFWNTWKEGAEAALDNTDYLKWDAVGYNSTHAVEALERACATSDAVVVTVPYAKGTEDYDKMDEAINKCIFEYQKPVFTANTDTYHNNDVFAYIGSSNYDTGVKCALSILFPDDTDVISGRKVLPGKDETDHSMDIQIYWDATSMLDEGLRQRFEGLATTLKMYKADDEVVRFLPGGRPSCPCVDQFPDGVPSDDEGLRVTIDGKIYDYPPKYGLKTCSRHDKNMIPSCSGSNPPDFCDNTWCYVDPQNCNSVESSTVGGYVWTDYPDQEYPYSYETCGSPNVYVDFIGGSSSGDDADDGTLTEDDDKQMIVLSSNWAPKLNPTNRSVFICGDETFSMPHVAQYGQSPWLQGMTSVSVAATAARGIAKRSQWRAFKGNSAASTSSSSYNGPGNFGSFDICLRDRATNMNVEGARVQCWDNDNNGVGSEVGTKGNTNAGGCYTAYYSTSKKWDWGVGNARRPDIYCKVQYNGAEWRTREKTNHNGNHFVETLVENIPAPYEATVCVESSSFNNEPVSGAHVQCWDEDNNSMGTEVGRKGMTGDDGCYTAFYNPDSVGDPLQIWGRHPDVYCVVNYLGQVWETNRNQGVNLNQRQFRFTPIRPSTIFRSKIKEDLSKYGKAIVNIFERFNVEVGNTWDVFGDAEFDEDWIVQHPPNDSFGKPSNELPVPEMCDGDSSGCDKEFGLKECTEDDNCNAKTICPGDELYSCDSDTVGGQFFAKGVCRLVKATRKSESGFAKKLCVGHSYTLYDRMYDHIIQAEKFIDVTSLDSPSTIGYNGFDTKQFGAMFRNAIAYLHSTGRAVTIKFMFGSIFALFGKHNENPKKILEELTEGIDLRNTKLKIWAGTYRTGASSWNHGKIIAVDGKKVLTGGTNYYPEIYLREDPVFDVNIMVSNGPAVGAHKYSAKLWSPLCDWTFQGTGTSHVEAASVNSDGNVVYVRGECPPAFPAATNFYDGKTANGAMVIQAARLGRLASDAGGNEIEHGQKSSDLAMFAMMESAVDSIYFSQQDLLPVILANNPAGTGGWYTSFISIGSSGITDTSFDDTWRMFSGIAKAVSRNVTVSIMVSAPCAQGAGNPNSQSKYQLACPTDGTQGDGYNYWDNVYKYHGGKWPSPRSMDKMYAHITARMSPLGDRSSNDRRLGYGYGWSLENIADWIFAYYAINRHSRPRDVDGRFKNHDEVADHICEFVKIAHVRLNKDEPTYMRGDKKGGQVGNHAKILMVDEKIFYIGSDNTYGGGLAEFGLIVDDETRSKDFATDYWNVLWTEARGKNDTGLVSGREKNDTGLTPTCNWRKEHYKNFGWKFND